MRSAAAPARTASRPAAAGSQQRRVPAARTGPAAPSSPQHVEPLVDIGPIAPTNSDDRPMCRASAETRAPRSALRASAASPRGIRSQIDDVRMRCRCDADPASINARRVDVRVRDHQIGAAPQRCRARDGAPAPSQPGVAISAPPRRAVVVDRPRGVHRMHPVDVGPGAVAAVDDDAAMQDQRPTTSAATAARSREQTFRERGAAARPRHDVRGRRRVLSRTAGRCRGRPDAPAHRTRADAPRAQHSRGPSRPADGSRPPRSPSGGTSGGRGHS